MDFADAQPARQSAWAQAVYDKARGACHAHAVRILAQAWIRVIWRCWTDHTPYDHTCHASALRLHSPEESNVVEARLNHRPRKILGWRTPLQVFTAMTR